jgi:hypothetical protein
MNKGLHSFSKNDGRSALNSFPKKRGIQDLMFDIPAGRDSYDFKVSVSAQGQLIRLNLQGTAGKSIIIDWGDGNSARSFFSGNSENFDHNYNSLGEFNVNIFCDVECITRINVSNQKLTGRINRVNRFYNLTYFAVSSNQISGTLPDFSQCTQLVTFDCSNNQFYGELPSFNNCPNLYNFYCHYNQFSGELPSFGNCVGLTVFYCNNNQFTSNLPSFNNCSLLTNFFILFNR